MLFESFIQCIRKDLDRSFPNWNMQTTEQWHKCCAQVGGNNQVVLWIKNPNKEGGFWVYVSVPLTRVTMIPGITVTDYTKDPRKYWISLENKDMTPMELNVRESGKSGSWERNWPVGFKLTNMSQFELAKRIVISQWD